MIEFSKSLVGGILEFLFGLTEMINFPSYALALVIFTVIIKLVLYPLNRKQMNSMKGMQLIQPKIQDVQKKYANNPQKQQEEMLKLYKEYDINPLAGCLPLLIQMPIIILLYQGILNFVPVNVEYFTFFGIGGLSLADKGGIIIAVAMALATFFSSYTSMGVPKEPMQKTMLYGMPIFMGYMALNFPSGVCLYWMAFSIVSGLQQIIINKGLTPQRGAARKEAKEAAEGGTQTEVIDVTDVKEEKPVLKDGKPNPNTSKKKKK